MSADDRYVDGCCPMGCGRTLFLGDGGDVTCSYLHCPDRGAVAEILADTETEHVVVIGDGSFTIRHPLRERLGDQLLTCALHEHLANLAGPPVKPGKYRARAVTGPGWAWEAMPS